MAQQVQDLINKIKLEGIEEAKKQASSIETEAQAKAKSIIEEAEAQAEKIKQMAQDDAKKLDASTRAALAQASRDVLLSLKQDVQGMLKKIVAKEFFAQVSGENLQVLLEKMVTNAKDGVDVALRAEDLDEVKSALMKKLQDELKAGVSFRSRDDGAAGFVVSFDEGKSSFDFTDESLTAYLSVFLNDEIDALLTSN